MARDVQVHHQRSDHFLTEGGARIARFRCAEHAEACAAALTGAETSVASERLSRIATACAGVWYVIDGGRNTVGIFTQPTDADLFVAALAPEQA